MRPLAGGSSATEPPRRRQRAVVVGLELPDAPETAEPPLAELKRLAETAGADVLGEIVQRRPRPDAAHFIGKGKVEEAAALAKAVNADVVIFDNDLSPAQERNLEKIIGRPICDRSRLILDIFATRARSRQAALQVELAQLEYQKPRLKRMWTHLERMEGAIGSRGPGEKQIEEDKRIIGKRIANLKRQLEVVERQRESRSSSRAPYFKVSLVGYTNAGKSTLLHRLTGADAFIEDKLFATLDTQTRAWHIAGNIRVFLSDTVGFIRDLPKELFAAFRATFEEAEDADLLLHVVDVSDPAIGEHIRATEHLLGELGLAATPTLLVFNKADRLPVGDAESIARGRGGIAVSALERESLRPLLAEMERRLFPDGGRRLLDDVEQSHVGTIEAASEDPDVDGGALEGAAE